MKTITDLFEGKESSLFKAYQATNEKSKIKSERAEIIQKFMVELNKDRVDSGRKELSPAFVSMRMSDAKLKTNSDLYQFYKICANSKSFSRTWWGALKVKK